VAFFYKQRSARRPGQDAELDGVVIHQFPVACGIGAGLSRIVCSAAKIVRARGGMGETMEAMLEVYREIAAPDKLKCTGGTWWLPLPVVKEHIAAPFLEICGRLGMKAAFYTHDLVAAGRAEPAKIIDVASAPDEDLNVNN
jgi:hypothetical protein